MRAGEREPGLEDQGPEEGRNRDIEMDFQHACPKYEKAAALLGKKWTGMILRSLLEGPRRFTDIAAYVDGLSDNLLSRRLQELEAEGIVIRQVLAQRPVVVEYSLTPKGEALREVVESIQRWADQWEPLPATAR